MLVLLTNDILWSTESKSLTSTGNGAVIPPRCASGVDGPTDTDDERCILLFARCTVKLTVADAVKEEDNNKITENAMLNKYNM